jgi:hypothetical protein
LWINENGQIGFADLGGYSSAALTPDTWHRVVIAAKLQEESFKVYIDDTLVFTATSNYGVDGRVSLLTDDVYIGYDNSGYPGPEFADLKMWKVALTDAQISTLGQPQ